MPASPFESTCDPAMLARDHTALRPLTQEDVGEHYLRWLNDPRVNRYLESRFATHTLESIADFVRGHGPGSGNHLFAIVAQPEGRHIGNIKLGPVSSQHRHGDIGILVGEPEYWGQGHASVAIDLLTRFAFEVLGLHKVTAGCYGPNVGSRRAFERAGFVVEGIRPSHYLCDGEFVDGILMARVRP